MPLMCFIHGEPPLDIRVAVQCMEELGAEHTFLATDLGQAHSPLSVDWYRMFLAALLKCGVSEGAIRMMACDNTARLLGD
jgi:hypothetical protein